MDANAKHRSLRTTLMLLAAVGGWFWGAATVVPPLSSGAQVLPASADAAWALFSPDGRSLLGGAGRNAAQSWDLEKNTRSETLPVSGSNSGANVIVSAAFSRDGTRLALGLAGGGVRLIDWKSRRRLRAIDARQGGAVRQVHFTADGRYLWTWGGPGDGALQVWASGSGTSAGSVDAGRAMAASPAEPEMAVAYDRGIQIYTADGSAKLRGISDYRGEPRALAYSPDGARIALALDDGEVRIFSAKGRLEHTLNASGADLENFAWSSDSKYLAVGSDVGEIFIWNVISGVSAAEVTDPEVVPSVLHVLAFEPGSYRLLYSRVTEDESDLRLIAPLGEEP